MELTALDFIVFFGFLAATFLFGCSFFSKNQKSSDYTTAGGKMPTIVVGMSIFATYVSSISFLALPGNAYMSNWNSFMFSLSIPLASWIAMKYFVPFYRSIESVSAYSYLEKRFGYWARAYASSCYLLTQIARIGSVLYLMALPLHTMLGWSIPLIMLVSGICVITYSVLGGITAVIWTDTIQGFILIIGALACIGVLLFSIDGNPMEVFRIAIEHDKFSLGSFGSQLNEQTFWVTLVYGLFINLQNYGIDQNYVQRYKTAKDDRSARQAALFGGLLYVPVSMFFFFIGTALFAFYHMYPNLLPAGTPNDAVFPYFIIHQLPTGVTGLLMAAICAAGLSTVSTSINSSATIILTDFFQRKRQRTDKENMRILYISSLILGLLGMGLGLAMMSVKSALDAWWNLAGIFSGGMLGLFLLGFVTRKVKNIHAVIGTICGVILIAWMSLSGSSPFHNYLVIVFGTLLIYLTGFSLSIVIKK